MTDRERRVATFASELDPDDIPSEVRDHAGLVLADTVAAIVGGSTDPDIGSFVADTCERVPGSATVFGHGIRTDRGYAALANGSFGTVLELDEGHKYAAGHPAIHVLPAVLAEGEVADQSAAELLTAFVAGYEVSTRVARACYPLDDGYHPHGVWGAVGAAVGVATLRGYDPELTQQTMRVAANQAQHTRMEAATEGATVRQTFAGMANLTGILSADLAAAGVTGLEEGLARHLSLAATRFDQSELDAALADRWEVTRGYFKRHAACRYTHPTLDAVERLQDEGIDHTDVAAVRVETYPTAANLGDPNPKNALQAKFSLPFAVATRLVNRSSGKAAFTDEAITDEVLSVAERVSVEATDEMTDRVPDARSAKVTIELTDGRTPSEEVLHAQGGEERPFAESDIEEKFDELVAPVFGQPVADDLWSTIRTGRATPRTIARGHRRES